MEVRKFIVTTPNEVGEMFFVNSFSSILRVLQIFKVPLEQVSFYFDKFGNLFYSAPSFELCVCIPSLSKE